MLLVIPRLSESSSHARPLVTGSINGKYIPFIDLTQFRYFFEHTTSMFLRLVFAFANSIQSKLPASLILFLIASCRRLQSAAE